MDYSIKKVAAIILIFGFVMIVFGAIVNTFSPALPLGGTDVLVSDLVNFLGLTLVLVSILMFGYSFYRDYVE